MTVNSIFNSNTSNFDYLYNNYLKSNIINYAMLVLLVILCISVPILSQLESNNNPRVRDVPDAKVSFNQYSTSNGTTNVIVNNVNMMNSDFIIIFEKEQKSVVTDSCYYNESYIPEDPSVLSLTRSDTGEKYASILIPRCDNAVVKNLNINDTVEVYGYDRTIRLVDSYTVK